MIEFLLITIIKIVLVLIVLLSTAAYMVLAERRISAFVQDRIGPNRVGWQGVMQPLADVVKLVTKEDIVPKSANKFIHHLAPIISVSIALCTIAVVPFGNVIEMYGRTIQLQIADVNIGILYILALSSIAVYGNQDGIINKS